MKVGWKTERLGAVCSLIARGVVPKYAETGDKLVLNQKCVRNHVVGFNQGRRHDDSVRSVASDRLLKVGDVLVNSTGTGTLGRVAQVRVPLSEPTTVDTHVTIVRPLPGKFFVDFFGYMLIQIEDEIAVSGEGASGQTELSRTTLANKFFVSYPESHEEQRRIVAMLDRALAGIATAAANAQANVTNARALFDSTFEAIFASQDSDWRDQRFDSICQNWDGRRRPVTKRDREVGDIPYFGASGQVDSVSDFLFDDDLLLVSEDGANLLMRTYPIAFSISGKSWVNNHAHVLKFKEKTTQKFVELFLNSISLAPYVSGMAQPKLNQKALNSIIVPMPPLKRQGEIVDQMDAMQTSVHTLQTVYRTRLAALTELKQTLLGRAFAGELI